MRKGKPIKPKLIELFGVSSQAFALVQSTEVSSRNPRYGPRITFLKPNILMLVPCYLRKRFARIKSTNRAREGWRFRIVDLRSMQMEAIKFRNLQSTIYNQKNPASVAGERGFFLLQAYKPCCMLLLAFPEHLSRSCGVACGIGKVCSLIGFFVVFDQIARFLHIVVVPFF